MRDKILIVDDMELNREILEEILSDEYGILQAEDGQQALDVAQAHLDEICVILLDVVMPVYTGVQVLEIMQQRHWMDSIPVLIISGETSYEIEQTCLEFGASDFIHKPFDTRLVRQRVHNVIELYTYKNSLEDTVAQQTETLREQNALLNQQAMKLRQNVDDLIDILGTVVEARNLESGEHVRRVKGYTRILAEKASQLHPEFGLDDQNIATIVSASSLHDIGKIMIKDEVLLKPGKFTPEEFAYMKTHTTQGCELLDMIKGVWDEHYRNTSYEICRYHHERWDGRGYPDGLKGDEIPISAQLVSLADVYDALVNERVYKKALPKDKAFAMILNNECGVFSPWLLECFSATREAMEAL